MFRFTCCESSPHFTTFFSANRVDGAASNQEWLDGGVKKIDSLWAGRLKKGYLGRCWVLEGSWGHGAHIGGIKEYKLYGNHNALFGLVI